MGFSGVAAGYLMSQAHWSPVWASLVGVALGAGAGLMNGILVAYLRFSALIVTLGMLTIMRGSTFAITPETFYDFGPGFGMLGSGIFLGLPIPVWIAAAVCIIGGVFLNFTAGGRHVYAVGVNQEAAYFSGISIKRIPLLLFIVSGAAAGLGGIITIARIDAAPSGKPRSWIRTERSDSDFAGRRVVCRRTRHSLWYCARRALPRYSAKWACNYEYFLCWPAGSQRSSACCGDGTRGNGCISG